MREITSRIVYSCKKTAFLKRFTAALLFLICLLSFGNTGFASFGNAVYYVETYSEYGNLFYAKTDGEITITGCRINENDEGKIIIPPEIDGCPVTAIAPNAFALSDIKEVTIPDSVKVIGFSAFSNTCLTSIEIPASVESIGSSVFYGSRISSITVDEKNPVYHSDGNCIIETETRTLVAGCDKSVIPDDGSVTVIGEGAFDQCIFKEFVIPDGIEKIDKSAFGFCSCLEKITIPDSVKTISDLAFKFCGSLKSIVIPDGVESIGAGAFSECYDLADITIGSGVKDIGENAFSCCDFSKVNISKNNSFFHFINGCIIETKSKKLIKACSNAVIPSDGSVTGIGAFAFDYCNVETVVVPDCVTCIEEDAFYFGHLKKVVIGSGVKEIPGAAFFRCHNLSDVTIGSSVESIGRDAFTGCDALEKLTIPDSVKNIETEAFYSCDGLEKLTLGKGVERIGSCAFIYNDSLSDVYYRGSVSDWNKIQIEDHNECLQNATIHFEGEHNIIIKTIYYIKTILSFIVTWLTEKIQEL
jgi:hypothetical protein